MTQYTHPRLSPIQKLKARWRSIWLVANQAAALTDHLPAREAFELALRQHNGTVRALSAVCYVIEREFTDVFGESFRLLDGPYETREEADADARDGKVIPVNRPRNGPTDGPTNDLNPSVHGETGC